MLEIKDLENKIFNADCLELMKQIPDRSIDCVITDPPYGMDFQSNYRIEKHDKIQNDNNLEWLDAYFLEHKRVIKDDAHSYIFCSNHFIDVFVSKAKQYLNYKNIIVWHKNNTGMGDLYGDYAPQYEFIIFCSNGDKKLNNRRDSNIYYCQKTNNELHPTQKPEQLIKHLTLKSTNENDLILDPFLGSGTTAIACYDLKRRYIGIEKEPSYYEIAKNRIAEFEAQGRLF